MSQNFSAEESVPFIEKTRNSPANIAYYTEMESLLVESGLSHGQILSDFPVFTPRQQITAFLERYEYFKMIRNVPGSILELGVAGGFGLMSFAQMSAIFEPSHYTRHVYGFDTFTGFPEIDEVDKQSSADHMKVGGLKFDSLSYLEKAVDLYDLNRFIGHVPKVTLISGDVRETIPQFVTDNQHLLIALLYLDLDLYEGTLVALHHLLPRLPKGALIVFDELNHRDYPGETVAVDKVLGVADLHLRRLDFATMSSYVVV